MNGERDTKFELNHQTTADFENLSVSDEHNFGRWSVAFER